MMFSHVQCPLSGVKGLFDIVILEGKDNYFNVLLVDVTR